MHLLHCHRTNFVVIVQFGRNDTNKSAINDMNQRQWHVRAVTTQCRNIFGGRSSQLTIVSAPLFSISTFFCFFVVVFDVVVVRCYFLVHFIIITVNRSSHRRSQSQMLTWHCVEKRDLCCPLYATTK